MGDGIAEIVKGAGDVLDQPDKTVQNCAKEGDATLFLHVSPGKIAAKLLLAGWARGVCRPSRSLSNCMWIPRAVAEDPIDAIQAD